MAGLHPLASTQEGAFYERLSAAGEASVDCLNIDFTDSPFVVGLNKARQVRRSRSKFNDYVKVRATGLDILVTTLSATSEDWDPDELYPFLIKEEAAYHAFATNEHTTAQELVKAGSTVEKDSIFLNALRALSDAISEFHGDSYMGEILHARKLGTFIIEKARSGLYNTVDLEEAS